MKIVYFFIILFFSQLPLMAQQGGPPDILNLKLTPVTTKNEKILAVKAILKAGDEIVTEVVANKKGVVKL